MLRLKTFSALLATTFALLPGAWSNDFPKCEVNACNYSLNDLDDFNKLANQSSGSMGEQKVVKFAYMRDPVTRKGQVYFFDTRRFPYHADFVKYGLKLRIDENRFNKKNYNGSGVNRDFNLGSLIYDSNAYEKYGILLEMWTGDTIEAEYLDEVYQNIKALLGEIKMTYHPLSHGQEDRIKEGAEKYDIDIVTNDVLYEGRTYWALNVGEAKGYLRFITDPKELQNQCYDQTDIVVMLGEVPNEIGLLGGIITKQLQTPLSHINVKSMNRGTVNATITNVEELYGHRRDQPVHLKISSEKPDILPGNVTNDEIESYWDDKRPKLDIEEFQIPDARDKSIIDFEEAFHRQNFSRAQQRAYTRRIGAKATNIGVLQYILGNKLRDKSVVAAVPKGFGFPFYYYDRFMESPIADSDLAETLTLAEWIENKLNEAKLIEGNSLKSICSAKPVLTEIREKILSTQSGHSLENIIDDLLEHIESYFLIKTATGYECRVPKIRLRSSTNSEDLDGFTGAGLYNSDGLKLCAKNKETGFYDRKLFRGMEYLRGKLRILLPYLYSSVWNERAFEEREWYGLNGPTHMNVKVSLAVHRAFPRKDFDGRVGETANGVSVSKNIYKKKSEMEIYINAQHFDLSVTNPPSDEDFEKAGVQRPKTYKTEELIVTTLLANPEDHWKIDAWKKYSYEILGKSTILPGQRVLAPTELRKLGYVMDTLHKEMAILYEKNESDFAVDVEWKIMGSGADRTLWVKQARPFAKENRNALVAPRNDARKQIAPGALQEPQPSGYVPRGPRVPKN